MIASVRCAQERWTIGIAAAVLRVALMAIPAIPSPLSLAPGIGHHPTVVSGGLGAAVALAAIAGPLTSFAVVALAWRRTRDLPAAEERRASRPLHAWIPVGIIDAIFVVIQIGALVIARDY